MKKSRSISLGLVPLVAASFASCEQAPTHQRVCVDQQTRVVQQDQCWASPGRGGGATSPYHWYYMPYHRGVYAIGSALNGGSLTPPTGPGVRMADVVRGGFGNTAGSVGG